MIIRTIKQGKQNDHLALIQLAGMIRKDIKQVKCHDFYDHEQISHQQ
jgi:hypothetical protein